MNSRFLARRSAEDFASGVDALERGQTADERADAHLLELVGALRSAEAPAPRPAFVDDLRERLMAEAEATLSPQSAKLSLPPRTRGVRERRFVAAASVAVLLGGSATMAAASQDALPGEALYPIKRGLEQARSTLTFSEDSKGARLLDRATGRLAEASRLATDGGDIGAVGLEERLRSTLDDFAAHADEGVALLFASYAETGDESDVETVRAFLTTSLGSLDALTDQLPAELHGQLSELALQLRELDAEALRLCGDCGPADVLELPATFLAFGEVKDALAATGEVPSDELSNAHPMRPEVVIEIPTLPSAPDQPAQPARPGDKAQPQQPPAQGGSSAPTVPDPTAPVAEDPPKGLISTVVDILRGGQATGAKPTAPQGEDSTGTGDKGGDKGGEKAGNKPSSDPTPTDKPLQGLGEGLGGLLNSLLGGS